MAERGALDRSHQVRSVNRVDSGPLNHHQDTCVNRDLSKILQSRFNHAFDDSCSDTWMHLDPPMKIGRAKKMRDPRILCNLSCRSSFKLIRWSTIFTVIFPIKTMFFLVNITFRKITNYISKFSIFSLVSENIIFVIFYFLFII